MKFEGAVRHYKAAEQVTEPTRPLVGPTRRRLAPSFFAKLFQRSVVPMPSFSKECFGDYNRDQGYNRQCFGGFVAFQ
jgi:hypothetical protein